MVSKTLLDELSQIRIEAQQIALPLTARLADAVFLLAVALRDLERIVERAERLAGTE